MFVVSVSKSRKMFIYLSKKIAIPNNTRLNCIAWNKDDGYIAVGGEDGLLKVLKLDSGVTPAQPDAAVSDISAALRSRGLAAASNLSMNQTLEGHSESIRVITWNESHKKLTSSDQNGVIIVWMLYKGAWYEEMINNRKKSTVVGMAWSTDGLKICIIYEDGAVIVGSVDGNRIWGKELKGLQLAGVQWSPDGKLLLFSLNNGQVHLYDNYGNFVMHIEIECLERGHEEVAVVGLDWYNGKNGLMHAGCPCLAICYENGRVQLMCNESDPAPVIIDTAMTAVSCSWNHNGSLLAVAGRQVPEGTVRESNAVQFYSPFGDHMRTLKVPGQSIASAVWEGGSLRVALAVDTYVYFANIRPDYQWCFCKRTVVYASASNRQYRHQSPGYNTSDGTPPTAPPPAPTKPRVCITFWDTLTNQIHTRHLPVLLALAACQNHCVLVTSVDERDDKLSFTSSYSTGQYALLLCNSVGTAVDGAHVDLPDVAYVTMNGTHVIVASRNNFVLWHYGATRTGAQTTQSQGSANRKLRFYHVDDSPSGAVEVIQDLDHHADLPVRMHESTDPICCITCSDRALIVGRESGVLQHYALPHVALFNRYKVNSRPHKLAMNCTSSRLSIIDISGVLTVIETPDSAPMIHMMPPSPTTDQMGTTDGQQQQQHLLNGTSPAAAGKLERKDVWAMCWASDNPLLFAIMEKTRMYIFKGTSPEEPISCSGYICSFQDLEIQAVLLDELMETPDKPNKEHLVKLEVKSLRDTRQLVEKVGIDEATQFIEDNPHPRLWRLLAEGALKQLNLKVAEAAFIRSLNYAGILFVKKVQDIPTESIRKAMVATYFKQYDEAEKYYMDCDRRDLALTLRQTLGDWFRVIQMMKNGVSAPDIVLETAYNSTGEYFAQYNNWSAAIEYFELAKNKAQMVECYYQLEDYDSLRKIIEEIPERDPLLRKIAEMFATDAVYDVAVDVYTKLYDIRAAVDLCVTHNRWDQGIALAQEYGLMDISNVFAKYTTHLASGGRFAQAIEICVQANHLRTAAELLRQLACHEASTRLVAADEAAFTEIFQLYLFAGRLARKARVKMSPPPAIGGNGNAHNEQDEDWHGAEAYHYLLIAQKQLYGEQPLLALCTSIKLENYLDILGELTVYSMIALAASQCGCYGECSRAIQELGLLELSADLKQSLAELTVDMFSEHRPENIKTSANSYSCYICKDQIMKWMTSCPGCFVKYPTCMITGQPIHTPPNMHWACPMCNHQTDEGRMAFRRICPFCHININLS